MTGSESWTARMRRATCSLACDGEAPRRVRAFVRDLLRRWHVPTEMVENAQLLVSELVANAVVHGACDRTDVTVVADVALTISVSDRQALTDLTAVRPHVDINGGWGLHLLETIADEWGTRPTSTGKDVWFRLRFDRYVAEQVADHPPGIGCR